MAKDKLAGFMHAVERARRQVVLEQIQDRPDLTLGELMDLEHDLLDLVRTITIEELRTGGPSVSRDARAEPQGRKRARTKQYGVDTRSQKGRARYDKAVLAALRSQGTAMSAAELRAAVGGTAQQLRAATKRLAAKDKVKVIGQTSRTRYAAK